MTRIIALRVCLLLIVAMLIGRLAQLQLADTDAQRVGSAPDATYQRSLTVQPRRGEILANDGRTLLAESVPIYNIAVVPGRLPSSATEPERRAQVLGRLAQIAELSSTLVLEPSTMLNDRPGLRAELGRLQTLPLNPATQTLTVTVLPADTLRALEISRTYSDVLTLLNPIEQRVSRGDVRRYQSVIIKEDISAELALVIRENSNYLPGVLVVEGFRRSYPLSGEIPSLSHLLGYIGRINQCELMAENPASSWLTGMVDLVGNAGACGLIPKRIEPTLIGLPPYNPDDRIGKDGLEAAYEAELHGVIGIETLQVDALERPLSAPRTLRPVSDGQSLVLTLDVEFQAEVERIIRRWIAEGERRRSVVQEAYKREYDPIVAGSAVVLDPRDGRILAMVSLPNYDNNVWVDPGRTAELQALLAPSDEEALRELVRLAPLTNRAIAGLYPAGSTLKQFVGAVALHEQIITPETTLRDPGLIRLIERSGIEFILPNSVRNRDNGELTVIDAMRLSSNVFFASIAGGNDEVINLDEDSFRTDGLGIDRLVRGLESFGMGRPTGIDLAGEAGGLVPTQAWKAQNLRESWTTGDTYNTAIGQGYLQVTPLQLAMAAGAVARDGTYYRPHLVERIIDSSGATVRRIAPELKGRANIDPNYLAVMREGMRQSVTEGLNIAARQECSGLLIAGKTGTAEFGPILTEDGRRQSHSWFVGFAPYDDPQVVVAVLLEGTGDLNDGSSTMAVPAVTQIIQAYFGVTPPEDAPRICPVMPLDPEPATTTALEP
ncbi:MAG: peptidoglycan glycosyltransferase [Oscillochloris sp.]|nr:peptidoglycan glycosyltransferase [Oscillochloris sp.]